MAGVTLGADLTAVQEVIKILKMDRDKTAPSTRKKLPESGPRAVLYRLECAPYWRKSALLAASLLLGACAIPDGAAPGKSAINGPLHHSEDGFRNPYPVDQRRRSFFYYWYMRLFMEDFPNYEEVAHLVPRKTLDTGRLSLPTDIPRVVWIGHATFLVQYRDMNLLTDPHFSERASPYSFTGPKRLVPLPLRLDQLPAIDFVLISHNHYDQLDEETVRALGNGPHWLVPLKLKALLMEWGVKDSQITELDWWQQTSQDAITFTATPAHHWSARGLFDRNRTLWSSWMVEMHGFRFWFGGDTAYNPVHFKQIGERFGGIDMALIPIGAYSPRWFMQNSHVTPEEAVRIHQEIASRHSLGMHWGTFQLTSEPMLEPPQRLAEALQDAPPGTAPFELLAIGEIRYISID